MIATAITASGIILTKRAIEKSTNRFQKSWQGNSRSLAKPTREGRASNACIGHGRRRIHWQRDCRNHGSAGRDLWTAHCWLIVVRGKYDPSILASIVVCNTNAKHELASTAYNPKMRICEMPASF